MILTDNVLYLKKWSPNIWEDIKALDDKLESELKAEIQTAKSGDQTLVFQVDGRPIFMHSKYNPKDEADKFIQQYEDLDKVEHVFFYGVGLGYHIDAFVEKYPDKRITLYEPDIEIMAKYLSRKDLKDFPKNQLKTIFVEEDATQVEQFITKFVDELNEELLLIQLPSYERVFASSFKQFSEIFIRALSNKKSSYNVNSSFEKRWTYNSMINLPETIKSPNILMQKKHFFEGKPVIVVAAGPSLQDEIENLKKIKENGTAYIFSVGTAINALLSYGIEPDAACTYDPSNLNRKVFEKINQMGITHIPLIYGSSVGYEVLQDYKGPKLHMVTSQDHVSNYYLKMKDDTPISLVYDAASIAIVTVHMLSLLNCNPIILVGQNLGYRNNSTYADNANVFRTNNLTDNEKSEAIYVESVDGQRMETNKEFNIMRSHMETLTAMITHVDVINSTMGGAKIANTSFMPLNEVMATRLIKNVVSQNWFSPEKSCYDEEYAKNRASEMNEEQIQLLKNFEQITRVFKEMHLAADLRNYKKLEKLFPKMDTVFSKILENKCFIVFIKPMNKVYFDLLLQKMEKIRMERNAIEKARIIIQEFGKFIYHCHSDTLNFDALFRVIQDEVIPNMQKETADV